MQVQEGEGWRLLVDPARYPFVVLIGGAGWAAELTVQEAQSLRQGFGQLLEQHAAIADQLMERSPSAWSLILGAYGWRSMVIAAIGRSALCSPQRGPSGDLRGAGMLLLARLLQQPWPTCLSSRIWGLAWTPISPRELVKGAVIQQVDGVPLGPLQQMDQSR
jgi:hypothetical protein